ncbi:YifB family Mg chelatase-like AAA ATPase [Pseudemcibacter aquimaris]|uniref:YifB family Mg chelatase-like AAA ATPase n=1 Tax=Pseudemcibacter aquimaris TaxID=2857064 RepID=UPI002011B493|nr:YifB family Mg chelatase-like AAA ATPase [Pseudemcibacter aquimaris]MCC3860316.1 YifB family Mg chelatase-like AAA ATPase [Pseudemcibacter aquimaris]WDU57642.1 YifB family Mg chelatase-like AAA ATPase [Pseudemcibacter aquimaris]
MVAHIETVAFVGIDAKPVDVQVHVASGLPAFAIVGLPDKAVAESKERVRAALAAIGLALPPKRITVNLAPADLPKEGSHFDLPIALGILVAMEALPSDILEGYLVLGELGLDGGIGAVPGVLPAALSASASDLGLICPAACGGEAAWAQDIEIIAAENLLSLINHLKGTSQIPAPDAVLEPLQETYLDLKDIKGQESAKRALEVAAAGGHNLCMVGPPGSGKSMLAARLPGILPPMSPHEVLESSMIDSIAGNLTEHKISRTRPYRNPHHSASMAALTGGGIKARPGEVSLAHHGVLFLDELPEFNRQALDSLRQPLETGEVVVARANKHVTYPARFQLIAAMNPCRCGHLDDPALACSRVPKCAVDYQSKVSGPLMDRIDIHIEVPAVSAADLALPSATEGSEEVAIRVANAREIQQERYAGLDGVSCNAEVDGEELEKVTVLDEESREILMRAVEMMKLTARGYHRVLRVARTIADLDNAKNIGKTHISEAINFRQKRQMR